MIPYHVAGYRHCRYALRFELARQRRSANVSIASLRPMHGLSLRDTALCARLLPAAIRPLRNRIRYISRLTHTKSSACKKRHTAIQGFVLNMKQAYSRIMHRRPIFISLELSDEYPIYSDFFYAFSDRHSC